MQPVYSQKLINKNEPETPDRTVFYDLKLNNCPEDTGASINADIRNQLKRIPNLQMVSPEEMTPVLDTKEKRACSSRQCAIKYGRMLHAGRAVIGSITRTTLVPGYTVFFEKGYTGNYITIDAGIKYAFDITKREAGI